MRTLLILLLAITAWTSSARADGGVGVVVTGDATIQPQLAAQLEDWLRQRGNVLVPSPLPSEAINALIDCFVIEDLTCARKVVEQTSKSPQVVFAKVDLSDATSGMRDVTITAYWFEAGVDPIAVRRSCASCTDRAMRDLTDELMSSLAGKGRSEVGTITLSSIPAGARVAIDGAAVGVTPLSQSLPPGPHTITISLAGHTDASRSVTVTKGETATVAVALERAAPRRGKLPLVGLGLGGAVLLTGIVLYAASEEDTGEKPEYRDTKALGIGLGIGGLAVVAVSAYFLLREDRSPEGPTVAIVPGGAYVAWGRTF
jgi:hypothetical protein